MPRRHLVARVAVELRQTVDLRTGAERRSTLDRRSRSLRAATTEAPGEHVRNALQLLAVLHTAPETPREHRADIEAALRRLERALQVLERR
ncbi:MAG TPA: hypothetical protein VGJ83_04820 [Gemmatimonadales bacterium]